jgi:hypothetical protein
MAQEDHDTLIEHGGRIKALELDVADLRGDLYGNGKLGIKMTCEGRGKEFYQVKAQVEKHIEEHGRITWRTSDRVFAILAPLSTGVILLFGQFVLRRLGW